MVGQKTPVPLRNLGSSFHRIVKVPSFFYICITARESTNTNCPGFVKNSGLFWGFGYKFGYKNPPTSICKGFEGGAGNLRVPFTWVAYGSLSTDATIELLVTYIQ